MQFTFRSSVFEICVRVGRVYDISAERFLSSAVNIRVGKILWSTDKGLRKLSVR